MPETQIQQLFWMRCHTNANHIAVKNPVSCDFLKGNHQVHVVQPPSTIYSEVFCRLFHLCVNGIFNGRVRSRGVPIRSKMTADWVYRELKLSPEIEVCTPGMYPLTKNNILPKPHAISDLLHSFPISFGSYLFANDRFPDEWVWLHQVVGWNSQGTGKGANSVFVSKDNRLRLSIFVLAISQLLAEWGFPPFWLVCRKSNTHNKEA